MGADIFLKSVSDGVMSEWKPVFEAAVKARNLLETQLTVAGIEIEYDPTDTLKLISPPDYVEAQEKVDEAYTKMYGVGYFRDSYNVWSLFWLLGLSWWKDVGDRLDDKGNLGADGLAVLKAELEKRQVPDEDGLKAYFQEKKRSLDADGGNSPKKLREYYEGERQALLALVTQAQELGEPLYCSV